MDHGKSSSASEPVMEAVAANGEGMIPLVEFAYRSLDYIDNGKIGLRNAGKPFILALCIYGVFFGIVYAAEYLLNAVFNFWILGDS